MNLENPPSHAQKARRVKLVHSCLWQVVKMKTFRFEGAAEW